VEQLGDILFLTDGYGPGYAFGQVGKALGISGGPDEGTESIRRVEGLVELDDQLQTF
jgi:hypothetical protein